MIETTVSCDIQNREHKGKVTHFKIDVIFDHDQEDGLSKTTPYFEKEELDICESCMKYILENRRYIYAYGAMGHNKYYLEEV